MLGLKSSRFNLEKAAMHKNQWSTTSDVFSLFSFAFSFTQISCDGDVDVRHGNRTGSRVPCRSSIFVLHLRCCKQMSRFHWKQTNMNVSNHMIPQKDMKCLWKPNITTTFLNSIRFIFIYTSKYISNVKWLNETIESNKSDMNYTTIPT